MTQSTYTPPYTVKDVHISPLREKKVYRPDGTFIYEPIMPKHKLTGIPLMDDFFRWLSGGGLGYDRMTYYRHHGLNVERDIRWRDYQRLPSTPSERDFSSMVKVLFGMEVAEFQTEYCVRTAKILLIHTDLSVKDVARRSSLIDGANIARVFRRKGLPMPTIYRAQQRKALGIKCAMYRI